LSWAIALKDLIEETLFSGVFSFCLVKRALFDGIEDLGFLYEWLGYKIIIFVYKNCTHIQNKNTTILKKFNENEIRRVKEVLLF